MTFVTVFSVVRITNARSTTGSFRRMSNRFVLVSHNDDEKIWSSSKPLHERETLGNRRCQIVSRSSWYSLQPSSSSSPTHLRRIVVFLSLLGAWDRCFSSASGYQALWIVQFFFLRSRLSAIPNRMFFWHKISVLCRRGLLYVPWV